MKNIKLFPVLFLFLTCILSSCHFVQSLKEDDIKKESITLTFDKDKTNINLGSMEIINLKTSKNQNSADIKWSYDTSVINARTDNYSAIITGIQPGTTSITASCGDNSVSCLVTVTSTSHVVTVANPYVYTSTDYVMVKPSQTFRINASLFGGTASDLGGFTWSIDNPHIASISVENNYCWITGVSDGIARLTVKHNKAAYGYSVLVNCSSDGTNLTYITTSENVISINLTASNTADFAVDLINAPSSEYASAFTFKVIDENGNELSDGPVKITKAGSLNVSLEASKIGECFIRCSHPDAVYDMDILVRVTQEADISFIEPSETLVMVSDHENKTISAKLISSTINDDFPVFTWNFSENASDFIEYSLLNGNGVNTGDSISIKGKRNGSVKITVSYPGAGSREIVILCRNLNTSAADAQVYISTSQNYIQLTPSSEPVTVNVNITNLDQSEIDSVKWSITNDALDGSTNKVIDWKTGNGTSISKSARSALSVPASAYCVIEPLRAGTAYIDISHPKALYPTRITVVVKEPAVQVPVVPYIEYEERPVIMIQNGNTYTVPVKLFNAQDESLLQWVVSEGSVTVSSSGLSCVINAPSEGSGITSSVVTVSYPGASSLNFYVHTFDTISEFDSINVKSFYSTDTYKSVVTGQTIYLNTESLGLEETDIINWQITQGSEFISFETSGSSSSVTGLAPGISVIKSWINNVGEIVFTVKIKQEGVLSEEDPCYLSTSENVVYFDGAGETRTISITAFNIENYMLDGLSYELSSPLYEISHNNENFTITSLSSSGTAVLSISHPLSENILEINLQTGNRYEYKNEDCVYISTSEDVVELYEGQNEFSLVATLNHTEASETGAIDKGFIFAAVNEDENNPNISISYVTYSNICFIKPLKNGIAKVIVSYPDCEFTKEVVVIVNPAGDVSQIPYITSSNNVITVVQGNYESVSLNLVNSTNIDSSCWNWSNPEDPHVCNVVAKTGPDAMISGISPGTTKIRVSHSDCLYSLELIVVVLDSSVVTSKPYISVDKSILTLKKGTSQTVTAQMIGGNSDADNIYFRFSSDNSQIAFVNSASESCTIKGMNTGITKVNVYNSRYQDSYSKTILVVVEDTYEDGVYISVSQNIIKLRPDDNNLTLVTAKLENGDPIDGQNFIWWADDYNIVSITSVADQCSIIPVGKSGTTKIHIKHEKSSKQADILVMVSNYDSFSFGSPTLTVSSGQVCFQSLQVPAFEDDYDIEYISEKEDVCIVNGSNQVAWFCGVNYGTSNVIARIKTKDGTVLAQTEIMVSVLEVDPNIPVISLGNSFITAEANTSQTLSAIITGEELSEEEKYNLKWYVLNNKNCVTLYPGNNNVTIGPDCKINFNYADECVLVCEHPDTGARTQVYIKIIERGEVSIELSTYFESQYIDDGSFTITANIINGTPEDYKNLTWSAVKVGGINIVNVSKAKGEICNVTPRNVGQTTVVARLPNGKTATCNVIIKTAAQITFNFNNIHVNPGYTEVINYTVEPENANINWITQMSMGGGTLGSQVNYFSVVDDPINHQLFITGLKECNGSAAGTIMGVVMGASGSNNMPKINVYVEYNVEVRVETLDGKTLPKLDNKEPDIDKPVKFNIIFFPPDLEIDIIQTDINQYLACIPNSGTDGRHKDSADKSNIIEITDYVVDKNYVDPKDKKTKACMTVTVTPRLETQPVKIEVCGTLPSDTSGNYSKYTSFYYSAWYEKGYEIEVVDMTKAGAFSEFRKTNGKIDKIYLGDGEELVFYFKIKNENAAGNVLDISSDNWVTQSSDPDLKYNSNGKDNIKKLRNELAQELFSGVSNARDVSLNNSSPKTNMIYLYEDKDIIPNVNVYHFGHLWDYYKDLPSDADQWNSGGKLNPSIFNNIDWWVLDHEVIYSNDGTLYTGTKHNGYNILNIKSEISTLNDGSSSSFFSSGNYYYCGTIKYYIDNISSKPVLFNYINYGETNGTSKNIRFFNDSNFFVASCGKFITPSSSFLNNGSFNKAYVIQNDSVSWKKSHSASTLASWFHADSDTETINNLYFNYLFKYMTPAISREGTEKSNEQINNSNNVQTQGTLVIRYKNLYGDVFTKNIPVYYVRRNCQAYINNQWNKIGDNYYYKPDGNGFTPNIPQKEQKVNVSVQTITNGNDTIKRFTFTVNNGSADFSFSKKGIVNGCVYENAMYYYNYNYTAEHAYQNISSESHTGTRYVDDPDNPIYGDWHSAVWGINPETDEVEMITPGYWDIIGYNTKPEEYTYYTYNPDYNFNVDSVYSNIITKDTTTFTIDVAYNLSQKIRTDYVSGYDDNSSHSSTASFSCVTGTKKALPYDEDNKDKPPCFGTVTIKLSNGTTEQYRLLSNSKASGLKMNVEY